MENTIAESSDTKKIAKLISNSLGVKAEGNTPEEIINTALSKLDVKKLNPDMMEIIKNMLSTADEYNIKYDKKSIPKKIQEDIFGVDYSDQYGAKFTGADYLDDEENYPLRYSKYFDAENYIDNFSDEEYLALVDDITEFEHIEDVYDDDDFYDEEEDFYDDEEDYYYDEDAEDMGEVNEVLSRSGRIKAARTFKRTARARMLHRKRNLLKRSSGDKLKRKARQKAVNMVKQRMAKKPLNQLSIAEKEKLERRMQKKRGLISKMTIKLIPKIKTIETSRIKAHRQHESVIHEGLDMQKREAIIMELNNRQQEYITKYGDMAENIKYAIAYKEASK